MVDGEPAELPPAVDLAAYRVVQESLTNVVRHAGAARATVRVAFGPADLFVTIGIVFVSILPMVFEILKHRRASRP